MLGESTLIVMDSDGSPDHDACLEFMTRGIWESKLFNTTNKAPLEGNWHVHHPLLRPGIKRVLLDVMYKEDTVNGERVIPFYPQAKVKGYGSPKAIIVLYSIPQPHHTHPKLLLVCHKVGGKGSGSGGHFMVGWKLPHEWKLACVVDYVAHTFLDVPHWGKSVGLDTFISQATPLVGIRQASPSQAFPKSMMRQAHKFTFPPYTMVDVLHMDSVAIGVGNCEQDTGEKPCTSHFGEEPSTPPPTPMKRRSNDKITPEHKAFKPSLCLPCDDTPLEEPRIRICACWIGCFGDDEDEISGTGGCMRIAKHGSDYCEFCNEHDCGCYCLGCRGVEDRR